MQDSKHDCLTVVIDGRENALSEKSRLAVSKFLLCGRVKLTIFYNLFDMLDVITGARLQGSLEVVYSFSGTAHARDGVILWTPWHMVS